VRAHRSSLGVATAVATELLYGCSFVFTKDAVGLISAAALLAWRFSTALAAMSVLLATRVIRLTLTRHSLRPLLLLAFFQPLLYYAAETLGVQRTTASEGGILIATAPVGILLASWLVLGRPPSRRQVTGILITFAGVVATVVAGGVSTGFNPLGYLLLLSAVASYSLYAVFAERDDTSSAIDKTFAMLVVGAGVFTAIALAEASATGRTIEVLVIPLRQPELLAGIGYLALGSSLGAFFLQTVAITNLGSNRYSTFIGLSTLTAVLVAALALGERLTPLQAIGGLVIMLGVYVANTRQPTTARAGQPDQSGSGLAETVSPPTGLRQ